jgi:hypothetical protein
MYDTKPRGEGADRIYVKLPATSGKLQVWTRLNAVKMPLTNKICTYFIRRNWQNWKEVFNTYFEPEHPLTKYEPVKYEVIY